MVYNVSIPFQSFKWDGKVLMKTATWIDEMREKPKHEVRHGDDLPHLSIFYTRKLLIFFKYFLIVTVVFDTL